MPHVTFIHGIANKPPATDLLRIWREALANASDPLPLGDLGVTSELVYWADLIYEKPDDNVAAHEGVLENTPEAVDGGGGAAPPVPKTAEEAEFLERMRKRMTALSDAEIADAPPVPANPQGTLERIPLPWFIKKRVMNAFLRDVHHYLFDVEFAPPGRTPVRIQRTIRERFGTVLRTPAITQPHIVVSHSMGTVIAYDCLKRVADCAGSRRSHHPGEPARTRRDSGQAAARVERCRWLSAREGRRRVDQRLRPARSGLRVRPGARERFPEGLGADRRGHRGAERGDLAALDHKVSPPAESHRGAAPDAEAWVRIGHERRR